MLMHLIVFRPSFEDVMKVHQNTLDDLARVNGMFTFAVFIGLTFASDKKFCLATDLERCTPDIKVAKRLVVYEVVSYSCYLLSSLVAKALKVHLSTHFMGGGGNIYRTKLIRHVLVSLSVFGSIFGCIFLITSMTDIVQIRLGKISCHAPTTLNAFIALVLVASISVSTYSIIMLRSLYRSMQGMQRYND